MINGEGCSAEKVAEAGAVIAGGHSVNDKEPKYGLAVTGIIDPEKVKRKGGGKPGEGQGDPPPAQGLPRLLARAKSVKLPPFAPPARIRRLS